MPRVQTNGIEIEYETFGDAAGRPLLLIMGLGAQMILWHEDFCRMLVDAGHYVIRFDNRDAGQSTVFDEHGVPNVVEAFMTVAQGGSIEPPYALDDMADDTAGLLDALEMPAAHVCGASMGGMIAQTLAIRHPRRVRSLTSIMSTTGARDLPGPRADVFGVLSTPVPTERDAYIDRIVSVFRAIGSPGFPFREAEIRERAARAWERGVHPGGQARQLMAILAHGSRREALRDVHVPSLVIHGTEDPLVPVEGGKDTAEAIPGAELMLVEGMGHDMPPEVWPRMVEGITALTGR